MADIADLANDRMQQELDQRLAAHGLSRPRQVSEECEYCGIEIPFERVQALAKMDCLRCVECQDSHERRGGGR